MACWCDDSQASVGATKDVKDVHHMSVHIKIYISKDKTLTVQIAAIGHYGF